ncbi:MAG: thrombospondin type 3 repeat-containing protein, partial [Bythopirellula sp.]
GSFASFANVICAVSVMVSIPLTASAADGWAYTIINSEPEETSFLELAVNNSGQVAYVTRTSINATQTRHRIRVSDGVTDQIVYEVDDDSASPGFFSVSRIGLNDLGDVTFVGTIPSQSEIGRSMIYQVTNGQANLITTDLPSELSLSADVNALGQVPYTGTFLGGSFGEARVGITDVIGPPESVPIFSQSFIGASVSPPVLNDNSDVVVFAQEFLPAERLRILIWRSASGAIEGGGIPATNGLVSGDPSINNLGFSSVVVGTPNQVLLWTPPTVAQPIITVNALAQAGVGQFSLIGPGSSISDTNVVAFLAEEASTNRAGIFASTPGGTIIPTVREGDIIDVIGSQANVTGFAGIGLSARALNDRGELVFRAFLDSQSTQSIIRATAMPGLLPDRPILPAPADILPGPSWRHRCGSVLIVNDTRCFVDPPVATGYTYEVEGDHPNFASVLIPAPLPGGDAQFTVDVEGASFSLTAGQAFDFTAPFPLGVPAFQINDIDVGENLDPSDPAAFVTGLSFVAVPAVEESFTMTPIVDDTTDSDGDGVGDSLDNCPAIPNPNQLDGDQDDIGDACDVCPDTAPGADVDAEGCAAAQLDADGDGVPNDVDICPDTPPGADVDSEGCSEGQRDDDGDGVPNSVDACPETESGAVVDENGCSEDQLDSDGDGVNDAADLCPNTPSGTEVDSDGCPTEPQGRVCDVDLDDDVDRRDIRKILRSFGQPASGPNDPRDANGNGRIDLRDALICARACDRRFCRSP